MTTLQETITDENLKQALLKHVQKAPFTNVIVDEQQRIIGIQTNYAQ